MKVADWAVQAVVIAAFLALIVAPEKWGVPLGLISFAIVGAWALLYPQGLLGWAKKAHPSIDVDDSSLWWVPRLIGVFLIGVLIFVLFGFPR